MKKILIIVTTMLFALSMTVSAFVDVTDSNLTEKLEVLSEFSIINGYDDGTFRPDNNITRAEFAKIITTAIMKDNIEYTIDVKFEDVADDHWAKDYIYISKMLGIVNGTTVATFEPNANITYEQAIKMIVAGIGYDTEAAQAGGYPDGYIAVANALKILSDVQFDNADTATRGNIALMIRTALDVPFFSLSLDGEALVRQRSNELLYVLHQKVLFPPEVQDFLDNDFYDDLEENNMWQNDEENEEDENDQYQYQY